MFFWVESILSTYEVLNTIKKRGSYEEGRDPGQIFASNVLCHCRRKGRGERKFDDECSIRHNRERPRKSTSEFKTNLVFFYNLTVYKHVHVDRGLLPEAGGAAAVVARVAHRHP